jgi:hypothetical protein
MTSEIVIVCFSVGGVVLVLLLIVLLTRKCNPRENAVNQYIANIDNYLVDVRRRSDELHRSATLGFPVVQAAPWENDATNL